MRIRLLAMLSVLGVGLFGVVSSLAGPFNGNAIGAAPAAGSMIVGVEEKAKPKECVKWTRGGAHHQSSSRKSGKKCLVYK